MFDWVPLQYYSAYFELAVFFSILTVLWQCHADLALKKDIASINGTWGAIASIILILYIGLRPVSYVFGDTINYAKDFMETAHSSKPFLWKWENEWLFYNMSNWFAKFSDIHTFFLTCAMLYIVPLWLACIRIFKNYYYIPLLIIFGMFTFWTYGVNGIRNGIGASIFILALTYVNNLPAMLSLFLIAIGFHSSVVLMIGAAGLAWFIKNSYYYLSGWITCVAVSYVAGGWIQAYFASFGLIAGDARFGGYLTGDNMAGELVQMEMVFRWDFLIYSAIGVAVGYYFIFRRNYRDEYYHWLYNIYLTTNAFWVLLIRAAYSNRFAQISWFILPLVLIYPFIKKRFWINQEKYLALAIAGFYLFSFYFNIIQGDALSAIF